MTTIAIGDLMSPYATRRVPQIEERRQPPIPEKPGLRWAPNRIVRRRERSRVVVEKAVPDGHVLCTKLSEWLELVWQAPGMVYLNRNRQRRLIAVAGALLAHSDPESFTSTPGHAALATAGECSLDRIGDDIKWLVAEGLLTVVAKGRSAEKVPKTKTAADGTRWPSADGTVTNERAVYAFTRRLDNETLDLMGSEPVDKVADPTTPPEYSYPPHARGALGEQEGDGSAVTESPIEALYERGVVPHWSDRRVPDFDWHGTTDAQTKRGRRAKQLHAALTLQRRNVWLRQLSTKHVAFLFRLWFEDATYPWTVGDILRAMDNHPDNIRWPFDGATGMRSIAAYVRRCMRPWAFGKFAMVPHRMRDWLRTQEARERAIQAARDRAKEERVNS
jgi:hypothetical protein